MILYYNFNTHFREGRERIKVKESNFPFKIPDDDPDLIKLKEKYYNEALERAAYKTMCDYSDMI